MMKPGIRQAWITAVAVALLPGTLVAQSADKTSPKPSLKSPTAAPARPVATPPGGATVRAQVNITVPTQNTVQSTSTTTFYERGPDGKIVTQTFGDAKRYTQAKDALGNSRVTGNSEISPGTQGNTGTYSDVSNSTGCTVKSYGDQTYTVCNKQPR